MECASADRGQPWLDFSSRLAWASSLWLASVTEDKALGFPSHCCWEPGTVGVTSTTFSQPKLSDKARPESRVLEKWTSLVRRRRRGVRMGEPTRRGPEDHRHFHICHTQLWGHEAPGCEGMFPRQAAQKSSPSVFPQLPDLTSPLPTINLSQESRRFQNCVFQTFVCESWMQKPGLP